MNIMNKMKLIFFAGLLLTAHGTFSQENSIVENGKTIQVAPDNRVITFVNNIEDLVNLLEVDQAHLDAITQALQNAKVYVNGHLIARGESVQLPVIKDMYDIQVSMPAAGLAPIINTKGLVRLLASFVEINIAFKGTIPADENEVEILYPIIAKAEEWNENFPLITIGYAPLLKVRLKIEDLK